MTENPTTVNAIFKVLVRPDGLYQVSEHSSPVEWIGEALERGAIIHTVRVELPVPPVKPGFTAQLVPAEEDEDAA